MKVSNRRKHANLPLIIMAVCGVLIAIAVCVYVVVGLVDRHEARQEMKAAKESMKKATESMEAEIAKLDAAANEASFTEVQGDDYFSARNQVLRTLSQNGIPSLTRFTGYRNGHQWKMAGVGQKANGVYVSFDMRFEAKDVGKGRVWRLISMKTGTPPSSEIR
jgi:hypothetical protein